MSQNDSARVLVGSPVGMGDIVQQGSSMRSSQALAARIATLQESMPRTTNDVQQQEETVEDVDSLASVAGSRPGEGAEEEEEELATSEQLEHTTALEKPIIPRGKRRLPSIRSSPASSTADLLNDDDDEEDSLREDQSPQSGDGIIVDKDEEEMVFVEHQDAYEDEDEELLVEKRTEMMEEGTPVDVGGAVENDSPFELVTDPPQVNTIDFGTTETSSSPDTDTKDIGTAMPPPPQQELPPPPPPKPLNPFALGVLAAFVVVVIGIAWTAFTSR